MRISIIVLAAGNSRRFHGNKLLHEWNGKEMYRYIVEEINKLPQDLFYRKMIVTQYDKIAKRCEEEGYVVIRNEHSDRGISYSIQLALEADSDSEAYVFTVCDQPNLKAETIENLLNAYKESKKGIGCISHNGIPGNPTIFSSKYKSELMKLKEDMGGKKVLHANPNDTFFLNIEDAEELKDVDTREKKEDQCFSLMVLKNK